MAIIATCGSTDLSAYVGYGYKYEQQPQYGKRITTMDGKDHSAKLRDRVKLTVPFIPLTAADLATVLALFPSDGAYVSWTFYDQATSASRTADMLYEARTSSLTVEYLDGTQYWSGLVVTLLER